MHDSVDAVNCNRTTTLRQLGHLTILRENRGVIRTFCSCGLCGAILLGASVSKLHTDELSAFCHFHMLSKFKRVVNR